MLAYFDGLNDGIWLKRFRCPICGAVIRLRPKGFFSRFQSPIETIRSSIILKQSKSIWLDGVSRTLPLRFVYSVLVVYAIYFGFGFVAFFLSNLNTVDALLQFLCLGCLDGICVFATYQREATTRVNFWQKGVIEKRETQVVLPYRCVSRKVNKRAFSCIRHCPF